MAITWRIWYGPVKNTIYEYKISKIKDTQKRGLL